MLLAVLIVCLVLFVLLPLVGAAFATLVSTLLFGLLIGCLARVIAPGRTRRGLVFTALAGVAGALCGSLLAELLHTGNIGRFLLQIGAAVAVVALLRPQPKGELR